MRPLLLIPMILFAVACDDGGVTDPLEQPLATPTQADSLARAAWAGYWSANLHGWGALGWSAAADELSSGSSAFGMRVVGTEPREPWDDTAGATWAGITREPWTLAHRCALDAAIAVQAAGSARTTLFGRFALGLCLGTLAVRFDEAFLVTEENDLEALNVTLQPHAAVLAAALVQLQQAIDLAATTTATYPASEGWVYGLDLDAAALARLAHAFSARLLASAARTPEARAALGWSQVIHHVDNGITEDFAPVGDDGGEQEWSGLHFWGDTPVRSRVDYRTLGPADEGGGYRTWLDTPVAGRQPFVIQTSDRRVVGAAGGEAEGLYFAYLGGESPWPPSRGTYHFSHYRHHRWQAYAETSNGPMPHLLVAEMDLLKAEALLRTGGAPDQVATLINTTRVGNGQLPPATAGDPAGTPLDGGWQQTGIHLAGASLWAKLQHEFRMETFATAGALAWATDRGWGDLVEGTPASLPPPDRSVAYAFGL